MKYLSIIFILVFTFGVFSQTGTLRKVTIALKNGDSVQGKFVSAGKSNVSIEVASQNIDFAWESIASLSFTDGVPEAKETVIASSLKSAEVLFVGDRTIKKFFAAACKEVEDIYSESIVNFSSEEEAIKAGFTVSAYCNTKNETSPSSTGIPANNSTYNGPVQVKGYYRKDGTYVAPHTRSAPRKKH